MVTRAIERAQRQVEAQNFGIRKHLLEYDDVMNKQRENIYSLRREILEGTVRIDEDETVDLRGYLMGLAEDLLDDIVDRFIGAEMEIESWDLDGFKQEVTRVFGLAHEDFTTIDFASASSGEIRDAIWSRIASEYQAKEALIGSELLQRIERDIMLQIVDTQWKDHLYSLDHLKEGIGLRGYGQRDPLVEYKRESFELFQAMKARIDEEIVRYLWWLRPVIEPPADQEGSTAAGGPGPAGGPGTRAPRPLAPRPRRPQSFTLNDPGEPVGAAASGQRQAAASTNPFAPKPARTGGDDAAVKTVRRDVAKVGRNDPCPCGSGKKYKKCHGAGAA